jgi:8-oxo-dGTP diphosphatase
MQTRPFFLAVGALIKNKKGAYLLIRRSKSSSYCSGAWETPGGKPDEGESISEALVREAREETDLEIALDGLAGASEFPHPEENPDKQIVMLYMNASILTDEEIIDEKLKEHLKDKKEHDDYDWFPLSEFPEPLTPALKSFVENLKSK